MKICGTFIDNVDRKLIRPPITGKDLKPYPYLWLNGKHCALNIAYLQTTTL